jgi:hypothetical protein
LQLGDPHRAAPLAATKPVSKSFSVKCCDFMLLPQTASSRPALENWLTRFERSGLADAE